MVIKAIINATSNDVQYDLIIRNYIFPPYLNCFRSTTNRVTWWSLLAAKITKFKMKLSFWISSTLRMNKNLSLKLLFTKKKPFWKNVVQCVLRMFILFILRSTNKLTIRYMLSSIKLTIQLNVVWLLMN